MTNPKPHDREPIAWEQDHNGEWNEAVTNPKPDPMERAREAVVEALQDTWNEFCADTSNYPDCFEWRGRKLYADFNRGNFATMVTEQLTALSEAGLLPGEDEVVVPRSFVWAVRAFFDRSGPHPHPVEYDMLRDELAAL